MIWFEYKYRSPKYIIENIALLSEFSITEYIIILTLAILLLLLVYYLLPCIFIIKMYMAKKKEKINKNNFIKQIVIQKEIEEEIEEEMKEIEKRKLWLR